MQSLLMAQFVSAACSRENLSTASQDFFRTVLLKSNPRFPAGWILSKAIKISENNVIVHSLNDTMYATMTGLASAYKIEVADTITCDIATLFIAKESNSSTIASLRIRMSQDEIWEVEILKATKGSHALFAPDNFPSSAPTHWRQSNKTTERARLVAVADSYAQALQEGNNTMALAAFDCPRLENGNQTTLHCGANMDLFKWPVTDRRWVADPSTGVVMGSFFFHYKDGKGKMSQMGLKDRGPDSKVGLWLHEYFKIENGKIVDVSAAMKTLGTDYKDIWGRK
jgi:hypothetical protein